jgi:hypothetical protein
VSEHEEQPRNELARQVVVGFAAGLAAGYAGPLPGAVAAGAAPLVLAGMDYVSATISSRRVEHATETLTDAADEFGAKTPEEFVKFITAAVSDEEHQELLARALTIAQDTAMRAQRRALGRALAAAASDTGTKVDHELLFIRVVADLDESHIRLLRLMNTTPPNLNAASRRMAQLDQSVWLLSDIKEQDPGLVNVVQELLPVLERHLLVTRSTDVQLYTERPYGTASTDNREPAYAITLYGTWFLRRLAEPGGLQPG